jgi:putative DNA primase/helicase
LIELPHWVTWRWVRRKWTKPPYRADDPARLARTDDPQTWNCFSSAVKAVTGGHADGIGFALTNSAIVAVDLDYCRDPQNGAVDAWAADLISRVPGAYIEITASGCGLRIIGRGAGAELHRKFEIKGAESGAAVELYRRATRYITVSGLEVGTCDELPDIDDLLDSLVAEHAPCL